MGHQPNQFTATDQYAYDADGNMTRNGNTYYVYDVENRLKNAVGGPTYTYDGDGQRVVKSSGSVYWTGVSDDALAETDRSSSGTVLAEYVFFGGTRVARIDSPLTSNSSVHYYFADMIKTVNVVTSATGAIQQESMSYPFGGERVISGSDANHYKFTGKERDTETGLDYFGARYYGSSMGRFMTPDPLLNSGRPWTPQSWNRYAYAQNNPLTSIDPDGLYDYATRCKSGNAGSQCRADQQRWENAIAKAKELLAKEKDPVKAAALKKALANIGAKGDKNGVLVKFSGTATGDPMVTKGMTITVDWKAVDVGVARYRSWGYQTNADVEDAAEAVHEGKHLHQLPVDLRALNKWDIDESNEREAYSVQSTVSEAGQSDDRVWNNSWANSADKDALRRRAIKEGAHDSMDSTRTFYYNHGGK